VNWASESTKTTRLDNSKSLKSFATGDTLIARYLHKDGVPFIPQSVGLFNLNELPNLYGTSQAAMDRFAPITFEKTFVSVDKYDPANKNHMIADPRFKYDPQFIAKSVAPAFLNCLLQELHNLMELGIDYSCTENKLDQIQKDNNHLFDFCESIRLEYRENSVISVSELWQHLEKYYFDQEILTIDTSGNRRWADPVKPSDKYVKGANQVYDRLQAIFPDISSHSMRLNGATKPTKFIKGISIQFDTPKQKIIPTPVYTPVDTPVIPQLYPSYTPVENPANPDTAKVLPSSYTPYTPVSSNYSEKKSKEELDPNFGAKTSQTIPQKQNFDGGTEENKKSLGQTGVYGVYESAETLTTPGIEGDPNWGITGVYFEETGGKLGYKSEEVAENSTNVQSVTTDTTPSIKMQLGEFKIGDRIQLEPQAIPGYSKTTPVNADVVMVYEGVDGWEVVFYEYERWNKQDQKYEPIAGEFGRGAVLSGWVKTLS
jgi:putative DNA primase/helicase